MQRNASLMKLGLFMMPLHPPARTLADTIEEDRQAIILADKLGFSEAWCGEHFSSSAEPIASPLSFFSSLVHVTEQIKFATGVMNLPQLHPAMSAAHAAQFDHLSKGRFLMGIGPGGLGSDFELTGLTDRGLRADMMYEAIDTILQIWSQDAPYVIDGDHWSLSIKDFIYEDLGIGTMLKPYQRPHPPIFLSIVSPNSSSAKTAGARGWSPVSANFIQARYIASHWQAYQEGAQTAGRHADPACWHIARSILVTDTDQEADEYLSDPHCGLHFYFDYFKKMYRDRGVLEMLKPDETTADNDVTTESIARSMVTWGSPDTVLDKLVRLHDSWGDFGTLLMVAHDWDRPALWQRSMMLLSENVMPRFSQHVMSKSC